MKRIDHFGYLDIWEDIIKTNLKQIDMRIGAGLDALRIGISGGFL
jgi:hypothetical protein